MESQSQAAQNPADTFVSKTRVSEATTSFSGSSTTPSSTAPSFSTTSSETVSITSSTASTASDSLSTASSTVDTASTSSTSISVSSVPTSTVSTTSSSTSQSTSSQPSPIPSTSASATKPAASSSVATSQTSPLSHGLSNWATAGIGIGCILAGVIIGAIAAFLFLRRRRNHESEPEYLPMQRQKSFDSKALSATPTPLPIISDDSQLDQFLLAPRPDREIVNELQSLGHLIQNHVEEHYHLFPVQQSLNTLSQALVDLGLGGGAHISTRELSSLVLDQRTRYVALQHIISRVIFDSVTVKLAGRLSMLPPSIASFVHTMPPVERHLGNSEALSLAFTRWRQLSAFLLNPDRSERSALIPDNVETQARILVAVMNKFLGEFVDEQARIRQETNLQDVIIECTKLGYVIFSQPAEFLFRFEAHGDNEIVVRPGLDKVSDEQGSGCSPQTIISPEVQLL